MKFMTKAEYDRSKFCSSLSLAGEQDRARQYHKIETPKISIMDRIKIKLGLKPRAGIKVRVLKDRVKKEIDEWVERPEYYQVKEYDYISDEVVTKTYNKFEHIPYMPGNGYKYERNYNNAVKDSFITHKRWAFQVWCDRLLRTLVFLSVYFLSQKILLPVSYNGWIWTGTFIGTMMLSKLSKFMMIDSIQSHDFDFWENIYVEKREIHYIFRCIVVFFLLYSYTSHYMMWLNGYEYYNWISAVIVYIIGNHLWFKYETDPVKKALK